jgi:hypothetical protein
MRELQKTRQLRIYAYLHGLRAEKSEEMNRYSAHSVSNRPIHALF